MSLYQRAAALIQSMIQGSEAKLRPEIDDVLGDLHGAHKAETQAVAEGSGQRITIDGSAEGGFLVSLHNGTLFRSFVIDARDASEALEEAFSRFESDIKDNPVPQAEVAPTPAPVEATPEPSPHVERPFDGDPNTLDVTRGRAGDEEPDEDKRPGAQQAEHEATVRGSSVPEGVTEAAPAPGTHSGNDQAVSYEADPAPGGDEVHSSEPELPFVGEPATTPGERAAAAAKARAESMHHEDAHGDEEVSAERS